MSTESLLKALQFPKQKFFQIPDGLFPEMHRSQHVVTKLLNEQLLGIGLFRAPF